MKHTQNKTDKHNEDQQNNEIEVLKAIIIQHEDFIQEMIEHLMIYNNRALSIHKRFHVKKGV